MVTGATIDTSLSSSTGRGLGKSASGRAVDVAVQGLVALAAVLFWILIEESQLLWNLIKEGRAQWFPPFEDAAMLFRYANNLASGQGLSWNPGELPSLTDGATDLGFVLALAVLVSLSVPVTSAAVVLNLSAAFATGALLGYLNRRIWGLPPVVISFVTLVIYSGPVNRYVVSGFSPPVFAFLIAAAAGLSALAARTKVDGSRWQLLLVCSGVAAGLAGWWRPEGFLLSTIMVAPAWLLFAASDMRSVRTAWKPLAAFTVPLFLLGVAWVGFRTIYIGQLLPTSAVMKSGDGIYPKSVVDAALLYCLWAAPLVLLVRGRAGSAARIGRKWFPLLVAFLGATLVWLPVNATFNHWQRMQWPLIPALVIIIVSVLAEAWLKSPAVPTGSIKTLVAMGLCMALGVFSHADGGYFEAPFHTAVSRALAPVDTSTIRLATTEAGLIPLSITGRALDTWGHNDRSIAESRRGTLEPRLQEFSPNMIIVHGYTAPPELELTNTNCTSTGTSGDWDDMVTRLYAYAEKRNLQLVRSTATGPCAFWSVFVASEVSSEVVLAIRGYSIAGNDLVPVR